MKSINLKTRLFAIALIPLFFFVLASAQLAYYEYQNYKKEILMINNAHIVENSTHMINFLQLERGSSASYLSGGKTIEQVNKFREKVDKYKSEFLKYLASNEKHDTKKIITYFKEQQKVRKLIEAKAVTGANAIKFYNKLLQEVFRLQIVIGQDSAIGHIVDSYSKLAELEQAKENAGILRAKVSYILSKNVPITQKQRDFIYNKFFNVINNLNTNRIKSDPFLSAEVKKFLESDGWTLADNMIHIIDDKRKEGKYNFSGPTFFTEISVSIKMLYQLLQKENELIFKYIKEHEAETMQRLTIKAFIFGAALLIVSLMTISLSRMLLKQLSGKIQKLNDCSHTLSSNSSEVSRSSLQLSSSATQQAEALHQTVAAIDEINAMVATNATSAETSQKMAGSCEQTVLKGRGFMNDMESAMDEIKDTNDRINDQIAHSNEEFSNIINVIHEICDKTEVINDIVFQTKLLSFNASVEAARAGEHGKGFAVVAEEVGNLANMSGNAANEISEMLEASMKKVNSILDENKSNIDKLIDLSKVKLEQGHNAVTNCTSAFEEISSNVKSVNDMVSQIATASHEQSIGISEVSEAINALDQNTQANSTLAKKSQVISEKLEEQSSTLNEVSEEMLYILEGDQQAS